MIGTFVPGANGFSRSNHSSVSTFFVGFRPDNKNAAGMIPGRSNYFLYFVSQVPIFGWIALNGGPQNHPKLAILRRRKTVLGFWGHPNVLKNHHWNVFDVVSYQLQTRCQAFLAGLTAFEIEFEAAGKRSGWSKRSEPVPRSQTIYCLSVYCNQKRKNYCISCCFFKCLPHSHYIVAFPVFGILLLGLRP